jgi:hypothetical protein
LAFATFNRLTVRLDSDPTDHDLFVSGSYTLTVIFKKFLIDIESDYINNIDTRRFHYPCSKRPDTPSAKNTGRHEAQGFRGNRTNGTCHGRHSRGIARRYSSGSTSRTYTKSFRGSIMYRNSRFYVHE